MNFSGFLEKNRDTFGSDLKDLIAQSNNAFLLSLFEKNSALDSGRKTMTLSLQFKNSLDDLMKTLTACNPYFIRCIKPNDYKKPRQFDNELCVRQLRYTGMLETARIRALGFPIRHTFKEFVCRYRILASNLIRYQSNVMNHRDACRKLCAHLLRFNPTYQFGQTKIFLKYDHEAYLETEREKVYLHYVIVLQRFARQILLKRWLRRRQCAAVIIQRNWRRCRVRQLIGRFRAAVYRLIVRIRARRHAEAYERYTRKVIRIQSMCRGYLARKQYTIHKVQVQKQKYEEEIHRKQLEAMRAIQKPIPPIRASKLLLNNRRNELAMEERDKRDYAIEANKIIDDVFGFLQYDEQIEVELSQKRTSNVSKMIMSFEAESRAKRPIPTKLLSRPVKFYSYDSYESRL